MRLDQPCQNFEIRIHIVVALDPVRRRYLRSQHQSQLFRRSGPVQVRRHQNEDLLPRNARGAENREKRTRTTSLHANGSENGRIGHARVLKITEGQGRLEGV